jgi:hypothetical protein
MAAIQRILTLRLYAFVASRGNTAHSCVVRRWCEPAEEKEEVRDEDDEEKKLAVGIL